MVFFFSMLIFATLKLCTIVVLRHCYRFTFRYLLIIAGVHYVFMIIWWIYGQTLEYSDTNFCNLESSTQVLNVLLILVIVFGYIICFIIVELILIALFFFLLYKKIKGIIDKMQSFDPKVMFKELFGDKEQFFGILVFLFMDF